MRSPKKITTDFVLERCVKACPFHGGYETFFDQLGGEVGLRCPTYFILNVVPKALAVHIHLAFLGNRRGYIAKEGRSYMLLQLGRTYSFKTNYNT
jgi:hypothetical protein